MSFSAPSTPSTPRPRRGSCGRVFGLVFPAALLIACGDTAASPEPERDLGTSIRDMRVVTDAELTPPTPDARGTLADARDDLTPEAAAPPADAAPEVPDVTASSPPPDAALAPDAAPPPPLVECAGYVDLHDQALVDVLHDTLYAHYRPVEVLPDQGGTPNRYTSARRRLFIDIARETGPDGQEGVECLYTGTFFPLAPDEEPTHDRVNTEHVRPRATLDLDHDSPLYSHEESDLNHLYPTVPGANSTRGSFPFGEPENVTNNEWAPALFGTDARGLQVFAPRPERRGDVARAMFYMTTRWGLDLEDHEEAVLRRWDLADPVDNRERARNEAVEAVQGNRNPYVDCPGLARNVTDFSQFAPLDTNENLASP